MFSLLKKLRDDTSGNVLIIVAASMPLLMGAAGIATDTIQWTLWKRQLQRAADSAAIAGVRQRSQVDTDDMGLSETEVEDSVKDAVNADLALNNHTGADLTPGSPDVELLDPDGDMEDRVMVTLAIQEKLAFSSLFMSSPPVIRASATAANVEIEPLDPCIGAFETANRTGITIGGNANITLNCGLQTDATASNAAMSNGASSNVTATFMAAVGGIESSTRWNVDEYIPYAEPMVDPYENIDPTAAEFVGGVGCTGNPPNASSIATTDPDYNPSTTQIRCYDSITVNGSPGIDLGSNKTVFVTGRNANQAGNIDIRGTFKCSGCTIILTNRDMSETATIGTVSMNGSADWDVTSPTTGKYAGIALMQDDRATDSNPGNTFNGGADASGMTGAIYFPSSELNYTGNATTTGLCLRLFGRRVTISGTSGINIASTAECIARGEGGFTLPEGSTRVRLTA